MSKTSAIEWTRSTFNPWWGCEKVSPACQHCYAERDAKRYGYALWGSTSPRRFFSESHWDQPLQWNRQAQTEGRPWRVFCGSMCDILEDREDLMVQRVRLWELIERTPSLTWLLLTKRPELFQKATPTRWWSPMTWPQNAWVGTTVENQEWVERRVPELVQVPAPIRFLSCEPLLGPLTLGLRPRHLARDAQRIDWVIAGGESGPGARPMAIEWVRSLRDQCWATGASFFFKQDSQANRSTFKDFSTFPPDLQIREIPAERRTA